MRSPAGALGCGLAVYAVLVLGLYGLHRLPFSEGEVLLNAAKAVGPGFIAGWLYRARGIMSGAVVGITGAVFELAFLALETGMPFGIPDRLALAALYTVAGSALTNALGGAAGESLSAARTRR